MRSMTNEGPMHRHCMRLALIAGFVALLFTAGTSGTAQAEADPQLAALLAKGPQALLEEADRRHNPFEDQTIQVQMVMHGGANDGSELQFEAITKGDNMRAIRFEAPADMKGMGVVIKGRDEIYVRLPDSQKVRRVGSHAKRQSFYGSDWNFDEMSMIRLSQDFSAKVAGETDTHVKLELSRRDGVDLSYPKLLIHVDKRYLLIEIIEYFDDSGEVVKKQERFEPKQLGGDHFIYTRITMTDIKAQHTTENIVLEEKVDQRVADSTFSRRWLVRGL